MSEVRFEADIDAAGLTGTWADLGISDGATWINERNRRNFLVS